ncbi:MULTISPECIES: hypothetical protein [Serratia]|uniref:hypothetical protein n=1 Tax=Serratia TaxID=613 RepID=UPI0015731362|nr:hypothetical protein [Serratia marcescens]MBI6134243.1 hypothetical protein [Serratia marcescens]MDN0026528.1 hypothetical protein [Serratia marcescens]NSM20855.1 hypothetical protein [Serratia marcescens]NSM48836.1 hypothetical protein [Serratia marcescens]
MSDITKGIICLSDTVAGEIGRLCRIFAEKLSEKGTGGQQNGRWREKSAGRSLELV